MKKVKGNKYLAIGSLTAFIYLGLGRFVKLPELLMGFCAGISISMYLLGAYSEKYDIGRLKAFKKQLLGRFARIN